MRAFAGSTGWPQGDRALRRLLNAVRVLVRRAKLVANLALSRSVGWVVPSSVSALVVSTPSGRFLVPPTDMYVTRRLVAHGVHDPDVLDAAMHLTSPGDTVLIVGAHIGFHVVPLAAADRRVVAIEANPATFALLESNLALNRVAADLFNVAAAAEQGTLSFVASTANTGGSKVALRSNRYEYRFDHPTTIEVDAVRLDDLPIDASDLKLVIVDIEGSELSALRGMTRLLEGRPDLLIEICPAHIIDAGASRALPELLATHYDAATDVVSGQRYAIDHVVETVNDRYGLFASRDVMFSVCRRSRNRPGV